MCELAQLQRTRSPSLVRDRSQHQARRPTLYIKRRSYETADAFQLQTVQEVSIVVAYNMQHTMILLTIALWARFLSASPIVESQSQQQQMYYDTANMPNSYNFHYTDGSGATRSEQGSIQNAGTPQAALDVLGTVRWYDEKGQLYEMSYKAGKRGYRTIIKKIS